MSPILESTGYGFIALWGLHILSVVAFFTGVLFLIVLAVKTFTPKQLKNSAIWLMVAGTIICLFTIVMIGRPWVGKSYWGSGMHGMKMQQMEQMMEMMTDHNRGSSGEEMEEHGSMMQMMRMMMGGSQGGMMNAQ